jgi:hypothetical protein
LGAVLSKKYGINTTKTNFFLMIGMKVINLDTLDGDVAINHVV